MKCINRFLKLIWSGCCWGLFYSFSHGETVATQQTVWFGTGGNGAGIYRSSLQLDTGKLSQPELAAPVQGAGFLCLNQRGDRLYSLGQSPGSTHNILAYRVEADGGLSLLGGADTGGGKPTHLALTRDEKTLLVAHYGGGSIASIALDATGNVTHVVDRIVHTGSSIDVERQDRPHPHWIGTSPDNQFVFVPDLGTDDIVIYRLDADEHRLIRHGVGTVPRGSGPRHLKFHPTQPWVYVVNEMGLSVTSFRYDAQIGSLEAMETVVALPQSEVKKIWTIGSEIRIRPDGRFVYAGIRGHDVIAVFQIDTDTGRLSLVEREPVRVSWPRNFGIDPTGKWLIAGGAESHNVSVFEIDAASGKLTFTRQIAPIPEPICVEFSLSPVVTSR